MNVNYQKSPATALTKWNEPTEIYLEENRCVKVHLEGHLEVQLQDNPVYQFTEKFEQTTTNLHLIH